LQFLASFDIHAKVVFREKEEKRMRLKQKDAGDADGNQFGNVSIPRPLSLYQNQKITKRTHLPRKSEPLIQPLASKLYQTAAKNEPILPLRTAHSMFLVPSFAFKSFRAIPTSAGGLPPNKHQRPATLPRGPSQNRCNPVASTRTIEYLFCVFAPRR
jgi:hypothetical protein